MSTDSQQNHPTQPEFSIQRIYVKDLSFEAPRIPAIFQEEWKPELDMQLNVNTNALGNGIYEVTLQVTVTANSEGKSVFLIEVKQAGIFSLQSFPEDQVGPLLGVVCPSILFPYAREVVSDLVSRGTFPPLYLSPVNFEALYAQHAGQQGGTQGEKKEESRIITH